MKNPIKSVLLFGGICLSCLSHAQHYTNLEWVDQTPVAGDSIFHTASIVVSGYLFVTGNVENGSGNTDIVTIKYDTNGDTLWLKTYDGSAGGDDYGIDLRRDSNNDIIVIGAVETTAGGYDYGVIRYDFSDGTEDWVYTFDGQGGGTDIPSALALDGSDNVYVVGGSEASNGLSDYGVLKVTNTGGYGYESYYDYNDLHDGATTVTVAGTRLLVSGGSAAAVDDWDIALVYLNISNGAYLTEFRTDITGATMVEANAMATDVDNNIYVTGYAEVSGDKNVQIIKVDSNLTVQWIENYDGGNFDVGRDLAVDASGNVYVVGYTELGSGGYNMLTLKYQDDGTQEWVREIGNVVGLQDARGEKVEVANDGSIYITGTIEQGGQSTIELAKYNPDGKIKLYKSIESDTVNYRAYNLALSGDDVYISGLSHSTAIGALTVAKFSILENEMEIASDHSGDTMRVAHQILVRFNPEFVDTSNVDNKDITHGLLEDFIKPSALSPITSYLSENVSKFRCYKVHPKLTTSDTTSISRGGNTVPLLPYFATFGIILPDNLNDTTALIGFRKFNKYVQSVVFNDVYQLHAGANDTEYQNDNHAALNSTSQYPNANINIEPAWDLSVGSDSVICGVFDSGIRNFHDDISDGTYAGSSVSDGYDYVNGIPITTVINPDGNGHGTGVGGLIGAWRNNNYGSLGVAGGSGSGDGVQLHDMKIFEGNDTSCFPLSYPASVANIQQSIVDGAIYSPGTGTGMSQHIQNHSWGGVPNFQIQDACRTAFENEVVLVVSSGNGESGTPGECLTITYPAHYKDEWILQVGASDTLGIRAGFSSCGSDWLDFVAPGVAELYSPLDHLADTFNDTLEYGPSNSCLVEMNGTSFAAPHVAGTAALMIGYYKENDALALNYLAPEDCEQLLQYYVTDIDTSTMGTGYDAETGYGRIDAGSTIQGLELPDYQVIHYEFTDANYDNVYWNEVSVENDSLYGIIPGVNGPLVSILNVNKFEYVATNSHTLPNGYDLITGWKRDAMTTAFGNYSIPSGTIDASIYHFPNEPSGEMISFDENSATMKGYVYEVFAYDQDSAAYIPVGWYPHDTTTAVKFAYSLYTHTEHAGQEEIDNEVSLNIYPNPASNEITIQVSGETGDMYSVDLYDMAGNRIMNITQNNQSAKSQYTVDVSDLSNGLYFIRLEGENSQCLEKVVICH